MGCSARFSLTTKVVSRAPLSTKEARVTGAPHPREAALTNP